VFTGRKNGRGNPGMLVKACAARAAVEGSAGPASRGLTRAPASPATKPTT